VGIGAARCGSTWWSRQLLRHPAIADRGKELHYFDRFYATDPTAADLTDYHAFFPRRADEVVGEWTPGYLYLPWVPTLLERAAPDVRLLCILRDPVEQLVSSINYSAHHNGAPDNALMVSRHLNEAAYGRHLAHWARSTDRPVLVQQLERCLDDPDTELARTVAFLGLDPDRLGPTSTRRVNALDTRPVRVTEHFRRSVAEYLEDDVRMLATDHPDLDLGRWPTFAHLS